MIVSRALAVIAGVGILAAVAHATITATGGYGCNTNAPLTIALAGRKTEKARAECSAIHFTICSQAIGIKYPYSGIFYS